MALHEMATNAIKYGALSAPEGHIAIDWAIEETPDCPAKSPQFALNWNESGGPVVVPPTTSGFGSTIIADVPRAKLRGAVAIDYAPEGFRWRLTCPAENALA
jgi:two-component sensor histidine kinase